MRFLVALLTALLLGSCTADVEPPTGKGLIALPDEDPDPRVVEVHLEAREGSTYYSYPANATPSWTYNGVVPGPLIDANVGDRLVVHFKNRLPAPTTIHWHGVRLPATMDGTLAMQRPIDPGGNFEYTFELKDAGLFWFHPHIQADLQVQRGLYGVIRVRGGLEPAVDDEQVWVLDDVKLKEDGTLGEYLDDTSLMMGREGNTLLINGVSKPWMRFRPGSTTRLRIVNVANGRFFRLNIQDHKLRVIGTDGGFLPEAYETDSLLISPGERYDVLVQWKLGDGRYSIVNLPYERGHSSGKRDAMFVAAAFVTGDPVTPRRLPTTLLGVPRHAGDHPAFTLALNERVGMSGQVEFMINGAVHPNVPFIRVNPSALKVFDVRNDSEMDHPFHLHGFFFQVLSRDGVPEPENRVVNKDTIISRQKSTMRLVAKFDEPGAWMYHCHILEHGEHGIMGEVRVEPGPQIMPDGTVSAMPTGEHGGGHAP